MENRITLTYEDTISYGFGLFIIIFGEYLVLKQPHLFLYFYTSVFILLIVRRYFEYKADKSLLFMLDLCYYVNISTILQLLVARDNLIWFLGNYALCMGVLMNAMVVWQNCFILHNISKMTSCLLHAFAPFTLHLVRWKIIPNNLDFPEDGVTLSDIFLLPLMMYFAWQLFYLFITEVILASWIRNNKDQLFAIRCLATDKDNGMHQLVLGIMRKIGVMEDTEEFDADSFKTKMIMVNAQLIYTVLTLVPVKILLGNFVISVLYMGAIFGWCIYQGATSYLQDFLQRYSSNLKID